MPTPLATPADLPAWLSGAWSARRVINGGTGEFRGTATFRRDGDLVWHETGHLRLPGYDGGAARTYLIAPAARAWQVRFSDGRPFHPLDLSSGRCEAEHLCGEDVYRGVYAIESPDAFRVTWRVTGPHKDDLIVCSYARRSGH